MEENRDPDHSSLNSIKDPDRPRGILSRSDREYLLGESKIEPKSQSERNARARIRERVYNAFLDFLLIDEHLQDKDRDQLVKSLDEKAEEGIHGLFSFLYQAAESSEHEFEAWISGGLLHAEMGEDADLVVRSPDVTLDIEAPQVVDPDIARQKLTQGRTEDLTEAEMQYVLWWTGKQSEHLENLGMPFTALSEFTSRIEDEGYLKYVDHSSEE